MSSAKKNTSCIFCGRSAPQVKMSKEHVIRAALRKALPPLKGGTVVRQRHRDPDLVMRARTFNVPGDCFNLTVNCVCKSCNEGWLLQKVERPSYEVLMSLMRGQPLGIGQPQARALALWAAKTAAVRAHMDKPPSMITPANCSHIMEQLEPPPGTFVWLGHAEFDETFSNHHRFRTVYFGGAVADCHVTAFHLGHMAIFIVGSTHEEPCLNPMQATIDRLDGSATLRLWPDTRSASWPQQQLTIQQVNELCEPAIPAGLPFVRA